MIVENGQDIDYDDGDEPEDESEQPDDEFDDIDEEGEEEGDEEEETPSPKKDDNYQSKNLQIKKVASHIENDSHSKVSTASTNEEQPLFKIKITGNNGLSEHKSRGRKGTSKTKEKKGNCVRVREFGENLDEETKNAIDNQLDQLVIQKPAALIE